MLYFPPPWRVEESAKCARVSLGERLLNWMTRDESLCRSRMVVLVDAGAGRQAGETKSGISITITERR